MSRLILGISFEYEPLFAGSARDRSKSLSLLQLLLEMSHQPQVFDRAGEWQGQQRFGNQRHQPGAIR
jgi:hypothetical protein